MAKYLNNSILKIVLLLTNEFYSQNYLLSLTRLVDECPKHNIKLILSKGIGSNLTEKRNNALQGKTERGIHQPVLGIDYDYILVTSPSIQFHIEQLLELVKADKDIIGYVPKLNNNLFDCVMKGENELLKTDIRLMNNLIEVDYIGLHFCLIKKKVFCMLKYPWFQISKFETVKDNIEIVDYYSEDMSFSVLLRSIGISIWVNPKFIINTTTLNLF